MPRTSCGEFATIASLGIVFNWSPNSWESIMALVGALALA
jgi:hypothetical protein